MKSRNCLQVNHFNNCDVINTWPMKFAQTYDNAVLPIIGTLHNLRLIKTARTAKDKYTLLKMNNNKNKQIKDSFTQLNINTKHYS